MFRVLLTFVIAISFSFVSYSETFTWKDENGKTHFGDQVPAEYKDLAKKVELAPLNMPVPEEQVRLQNQARAERLRREDSQRAAKQAQERKKALERAAQQPAAAPKITKEYCRDKILSVKQRTACLREAARQSGE